MGVVRALFLLAVFADFALALPNPEEIEKLVCKVASSEMVEKEATEEVCKLIKEHFPAKMPPNCESVVGALWDQIKSHCPKYEESTMAAIPSPEEIEKLVCKLASSEMVEKEATDEVCKLIKEHFPSVKIQPDCETAVDSLWNAVKARCPKREESTVVAIPSPEEIEKLVCKLASSEMVEKRATEEVCKLIKEHFPSVKIQPDCETASDSLWDAIKARCPKSRQAVTAFPGPDEVVKHVCNLASSEMIEKEVTQEVCNLLQEHFPSMKMQRDCERVVGDFWDEIKALCPKGRDSMPELFVV